MIPPKAKEILGLVVSICSIVSCIAAVYGVFKVVEFVVDVRPIVIPLVQEVKEGNVDVRSFFSGAASIRRDTVRVIERDTVYIGQSDTRKTEKDDFRQQMVTNHRLTAEEEQRLDKSADKVSIQEHQEIDEAESGFRKRMREQVRQQRANH